MKIRYYKTTRVQKCASCALPTNCLQCLKMLPCQGAIEFSSKGNHFFMSDESNVIKRYKEVIEDEQEKIDQVVVNEFSPKKVRYTEVELSGSMCTNCMFGDCGTFCNRAAKCGGNKLFAPSKTGEHTFTINIGDLKRDGVGEFMRMLAKWEQENE